MSRKKTVKLNLPVVDKLIKEHCRSNVVFCEKMGRPNHKTWVTDWHREKDGKPAPKGFPSPAEAVQMCALLSTTPEEILAEPDDIALVRELIEQERAKQGIKKDLPQGEAVELTISDWTQQAENWSDAEITKAMQALLRIQEKRQVQE